MTIAVLLFLSEHLGAKEIDSVEDTDDSFYDSRGEPLK